MLRLPIAAGACAPRCLLGGVLCLVVANACVNIPSATVEFMFARSVCSAVQDNALCGFKHGDHAPGPHVRRTLCCLRPVV
jgi:hypothetical protein